jgi:hypothetical protein
MAPERQEVGGKDGAESRKKPACIELVGMGSRSLSLSFLHGLKGRNRDEEAREERFENGRQDMLLLGCRLLQGERTHMNSLYG